MHKIADIEETLLPFTSSDTKTLKKSVSFFTEIDYTKRIIIFIVLNIVGFILQFGSCARFFLSVVTLNPSSFVLAYSMGNLLSILGMIILTGFRKQYENITESNRLKISSIFFSSLTLCIFLSLFSNHFIIRLLLIALVIVQMVSYWIYTLSYFPKIQTFFESSLNLLSKCLIKNN